MSDTNYKSVVITNEASQRYKALWQLCKNSDVLGVCIFLLTQI